jgi:hypothetical protein
LKGGESDALVHNGNPPSRLSEEHRMLKLKVDGITPSKWCSASKDDLREAVQCLRDNFIDYIGPYVINSGIAVFRVSTYIVTADELVQLHKSGYLTQEGLSRLAENPDAAEDRLCLDSRR